MDFSRLLLHSEDPTGTRSQIALRFLVDLQTGDIFRAAEQLSSTERLFVALRNVRRLQIVMTDVVANASLANSGPCTTAAPLGNEAAVVTCGRQLVVVHVRSGFMSGVQINKYFPHDDVYLGAHTHAYTNYRI